MHLRTNDRCVLEAVQCITWPSTIGITVFGWIADLRVEMGDRRNGHKRAAEPRHPTF